MTVQYDDAERGYFGDFGGRFMPEALVAALDELTVAWQDAMADPGFVAEFEGILRDELNVKAVELVELQDDSAARYGITSRLTVNARAAGPRLGKQVQQVIEAARAGDWTEADGVVTVGGIELAEGEYDLVLETASGGDDSSALALLAGGGLGTGRLRAIGASPWQAGLAFGGEVLVAGLLVAVVRAAVALARVDDAPLELAPVSVVDTVLVVPVEARVDDAATVVDDAVTDDDLADYLMKTHNTVYHPACTARMGPDGDRDAVLDPQLRVRGVSGLRVADGSAMPFLPAINPNITTMMIGEKCSDLLKAEHG